MEDINQEIDINDFFKFLKISCHVNDLILDIKEPSSNSIDFDELASNKIINDLYGFSKHESSKNSTAMLSNKTNNASENKTESRQSQKSRSNSLSLKQKANVKGNIADSGQSRKIHPKINEKLNYLISEGVLDSVLPFICPAGSQNTFCQPTQKNIYKVHIKTRDNSPGSSIRSKSIPTFRSGCDESNLIETKEPSASTSELSGDADTSFVISKDTKTNLRRKPSKTLSAENKKQENEVVIHVCDEIKNSSRDFICPQRLLVSKMGYFADVTAGQKLEDMDISVHCDIQIFEWLMKWIKKNPEHQDSSPQLDSTNVVPILVSASFLQMEPLLLDCLSFCHARLTDIVRSSTNLSCLNDSIITRLAAMFTNLELEVVKDKKERVTPRLWTKLIQSLCEPEPQALRGHYFSLAGLFRCSRCCQCFTQTLNSYITCLPLSVRLNRFGQLVSQHTRDLSWNLSHFISLMFKELKSWRKVYWKLWGHCHFLYCCICEMHFPVYQMTWCRFHPDGPQFLGPVKEGRMNGPAGRYPCCGQQAFRFETLPGPNGCQFREHSVLIESDRDRAILGLLQIAAEGGNLFENPPFKLREEVSKNVLDPKWIGMCLMPTKCRPGLLPTLSLEEYHTKLSRRLRLGASNYAESSSDTDSSETLEKSKKASLHNFSTSSDGCESEGTSIKRIHTRRNRRQTELSGRFWSGELSSRSNQDHQREFEEKVMKHVTTTVSKKTSSDSTATQNITAYCGSYIRLEAEWKEQLRQKNSFKIKFK